MPLEALEEYKYRVLNDLCGYNFRTTDETRYKDIKTQIEDLQREFVIVYVDKVPNKYDIICSYHERLTAATNPFENTRHFADTRNGDGVSCDEVDISTISVFEILFYCYEHGKSLPSNGSLMVGKRVLQGYVWERRGMEPSTPDLGDKLGDFGDKM
ncbi:hypothetical protein AVEN_2868-1 [Araneus ventricosus]|uniref:Uncharacterized protein n=2 Tax=Araneus ventricosus TaxID=182803 RepID=A0A4Y2UXU7_ARAVE|nr:hypothetical protein AVEN_108521-1 [Araneus ventricosus]GBO19215.1 hypothetical protein AVEN_2868-1 [Araneus ventricosus]